MWPAHLHSAARIVTHHIGSFHKESQTELLKASSSIRLCLQYLRIWVDSSLLEVPETPLAKK